MQQGRARSYELAKGQCWQLTCTAVAQLYSTEVQHWSDGRFKSQQGCATAAVQAAVQHAAS